MVNNCGVVVDDRGHRRPGRHHLDREAQPRGARRGREGQHRRPRRSSTPTTTPTTPTATASCPSETAGDRAREVSRRGAGRGTRGDQGDHRPRLRRPHAAPAGDDLPRPDDAAPDATSRSSCCTSAVRRTPPTTYSSGCPSRRCSSPATSPSTAGQPFVLEGSIAGFRRAITQMRDARARGAGARPRPGLPRRRRGRLLGDMDAYLAYVEHVAAESYAAGLSPLEAAQKNRRQPVLRLGGDRAVRRQPAPRVLRAAGNPDDSTRLTVPSVWPDMVAFHGGPIACHA